MSDAESVIVGADELEPQGGWNWGLVGAFGLCLATWAAIIWAMLAMT